MMWGRMREGPTEGLVARSLWFPRRNRAVTGDLVFNRQEEDLPQRHRVTEKNVPGTTSDRVAPVVLNASFLGAVTSENRESANRRAQVGSRAKASGEDEQVERREPLHVIAAPLHVITGRFMSSPGLTR